MKKIGIIGGTFNPIHIGHLSLAERVMDDCFLDEIWLIPTGCSYMKQNTDVLPGEERLIMAQLATEGNYRIKCLDIEVKRSGYTYSYETLEQLVNQYPDYEFNFIFGADCLFTIENWKFPERIFNNCTVIAAARNGSSLSGMKEKIMELTTKFNAKIILFSFLNLEISSTELRERIRLGKSVKYLIPDKALEYIAKHGFYQK